MGKRLDTSDIENELKGASAFFPKASSPTPPPERARLMCSYRAEVVYSSHD